MGMRETSWRLDVHMVGAADDMLPRSFRQVACLSITVVSNSARGRLDSPWHVRTWEVLLN
jgi:hypothetical protein